MTSPILVMLITSLIDSVSPLRFIVKVATHLLLILFENRLPRYFDAIIATRYLSCSVNRTPIKPGMTIEMSISFVSTITSRGV